MNSKREAKTALCLVVALLSISALLYQQIALVQQLPSRDNTHSVMPHQTISHTTSWDSLRSEPPLIKIDVVITTTFREQPYPQESKSELHQRHLDAVVAELLVNPDNCP